MHRIWTAVSTLTAQRVRVRGNASERRIYLTFDDGPHPEHTPRLLDLLARHDAKATFFLIGQSVDAAPAVVERLLAEGHAIGNHSMTHPRMPRVAWRQQWAEFDRADAVLGRFSHRQRHMIRPPRGEATIPLIAGGVLRDQPIVLWSIDSLDYRLPAAEVIEHLSAQRLAGGEILLFHDDGGCATEALEVLLPRWRAQGWRFAALQG